MQKTMLLLLSILNRVHESFMADLMSNSKNTVLLPAACIVVGGVWLGYLRPLY